MKKIFLFGIVLSIAICSFAQGYTSAQETLRSQISSYIANKGLNPEKQNDGLKFKSEGVTYYIEIDKEAKSPMYVRLCRYVKFSENLNKTTVSQNINDFNTKFGVKVCCQEKSAVISGEMFVTKASDFTYAFDTFLSQIKSAYKELSK